MKIRHFYTSLITLLILSTIIIVTSKITVNAFCSTANNTWCCELGSGWTDTGYNHCPETDPYEISDGSQCNYKCDAGGTVCHNGCVYFKNPSAECPTPTPKPVAVSCGNTGCNAPNYCVSGSSCVSNKCLKNCPSGQHRVGDCTCVPDGNNPQGDFYQPNCDSNFKITGWAGDRDNINAPVQVEIWTSIPPTGAGQLLATVTANQKAWYEVCIALGGSAASCAACSGAGGAQCNHYYSYTIPESFRDNQAHNFRVKIKNLPGTGGNDITIPSATLPALQLNCPIHNKPPTCSQLTLSSSTATKGDTITVTANVSDPNNNQNGVAFWWAPLQTSGNYCGPVWTKLGDGIPNASRTSYAYTFYTSSITGYGNFQIAANVTDAGAPALTCTGNSSCNGSTPASCCNTSLTTCGPNCNKLLTITPGCNYAFAMTATSVCGLTQYSMNFNINSTASTHSANPAYTSNTLIQDATSPTLTNCVWYSPLYNSGSCKVNNNNSFQWRHIWRDCVIVYGSEFCSSSCSKEIPVSSTGYVIPSCSELNATFSPATFEIGVTSNKIILSRDNNPFPTSHLSSQKPESFSNGFSCDYDNNSTYSKCNVDSTASSPVSFTHTWNEVSNTCSSLIQSGCKQTFSVNAESLESFFTTEKGNFYLGQTNFENSLNLKHFGTDSKLATYVFSTKAMDSIVISGSPKKCNSDIPTICSKNNQYINADYKDNNIAPSIGWPEYFKGLLNETPNAYKKIDAITTVLNVNAYEDKDIVEFSTTNPVTVASGQTCNKKNIFIINGNLEINPNLLVSNTGACTFIVAGKTTIKTGNPVKNPLTADEVHAFIITKDFETQADSNQFVLTGGLSTTGTTILNRNINKPGAILGDTPSEKFVYDGARYIYSYKAMTAGATELKIREVGTAN